MLKISFNFDEASQMVSNIKVENLGNKARGVVASATPTFESDGGPYLQVLDNKLQLSKSALVKLNAKADDRLSIQYINEGIGKAVPVIAKAEYFTDRADGNRITNKGTVAFRGEKRNTLVEFGTLFLFKEYKDYIWKLIPFEVSEDTDSLEQEEADAEALNTSEIDKEIEAITASDSEEIFLSNLIK